MNKKLSLSFIGILLISPLVTRAAFEGVQELIESIGFLVSIAIPIVAGLALLFFFWGLAKFIFRANDPKAREEGRGIMIWGIVALFVMLSVWGIIFFIQDELGLDVDSSLDEIPEVPWDPPQQV